jgi:hypothetical protein
MEVTSPIVTSLVIPNCPATCVLAGAIILDEIGDITVKAETIRVAAHFLLRLQLNTLLVREVTIRFDDKLAFWDSAHHPAHPSQL